MTRQNAKQKIKASNIEIEIHTQRLSIKFLATFNILYYKTPGRLFKFKVIYFIITLNFWFFLSLINKYHLHFYLRIVSTIFLRKFVHQNILV